MLRLYYKVKIKPTSINCVLRFFYVPKFVLSLLLISA